LVRASYTLTLFNKIQLLSDEFTEALPDFGMPRNGSLLAGTRVGVDVVSTAMPLEIAARPLEITNEVRSLHLTSTEISLVLMPGRLAVSVSSIMS
jgi:hypothetical protein